MAILFFALYSVFSFWVVFLDGADTLEGWRALVTLDWFAWALTSRELRFYVGISWLASLAGLLFSLFGGT
ncbi:hypothetical protein MWN52_00465 [Pseudoxanthomonas winnipegensis]|uniref:hypothetical protein n=1 Tax=Pseudoxanthomonas winnipegensis TaxID=2480810 RepID=UPI0025779EDC|nr:hypothetical protein [Pseudoxanthomonas winnipegensis]WJI15822.1 hypothetical protein MWN52_00465 [Pseudoxanthomonas winnipegensis]